ncbi:MAG: hypothetical protein Q9162_005993 [Coniocarpon cinnabarinum]
MASNGTVLAVPVALAVVSIVVVGLRFQVRHWRKSGVAVDDWLCIPALAAEAPALLSQVWGVTMANNRGIDGIALYCPICEICIALVAACAPSLVMAYSNEKATPGDHANAEAAWRSLLERQKREGSAEVALSNMSPEFAKRPRTGRPSREEDRIYSLREFLD